jgi:hypothetical protein
MDAKLLVAQLIVENFMLPPFITNNLRLISVIISHLRRFLRPPFCPLGKPTEAARKNTYSKPLAQALCLSRIFH